MPLLTNLLFIKRVVSLAEVREQQRDTRRFVREEIAAKIKERVIGQDALADEIAGEIYRHAARKVKNRTLINFIISGPTGTGKTELAKAIAHAVFGEGHLLEIDCGTLGTSENSLRALTGTPKAYQNSNRGTIVDFLTKTGGDGVILFDEYEKAAPDENAPLAKTLLRLLDEGRIQSQYDMSFTAATGAIVILSSNLKQKEFAEAAKLGGTARQVSDRGLAILSTSMSPEFLNRFSLIATPAPLKAADRVRIAIMIMDKLAEMHGIEIVDPRPGLDELLEECAERCREMGVRRARGWLERLVEDSFIEAANEQHLTTVAADWDDDVLILTRSS